MVEKGERALTKEQLTSKQEFEKVAKEIARLLKEKDSTLGKEKENPKKALQMAKDNGNREASCLANPAVEKGAETVGHSIGHLSVQTSCQTRPFPLAVKGTQCGVQADNKMPLFSQNVCMTKLRHRK